MYEFTYEERVYLWQGVLYNQEKTKEGLENTYIEDDVRNGLLKKLEVLNNLEDVLIFQGVNHGKTEAVTN